MVRQALEAVACALPEFTVFKKKLQKLRFTVQFLFYFNNATRLITFASKFRMATGCTENERKMAPFIPIDPKAKFRTLRHSRSASNLAGGDCRRASLILTSSDHLTSSDQVTSAADYPSPPSSAVAGGGLARSTSSTLLNTPPSPISGSKRIPRLPSAENLRRQYSLTDSSQDEDIQLQSSSSLTMLRRNTLESLSFATIRRSVAGKLTNRVSNFSSATLPPKPTQYQARAAPSATATATTTLKSGSSADALNSANLPFTPQVNDRKQRSLNLLSRYKREDNRM